MNSLLTRRLRHFFCFYIGTRWWIGRRLLYLARETDMERTGLTSVNSVKSAPPTQKRTSSAFPWSCGRAPGTCTSSAASSSAAAASTASTSCTSSMGWFASLLQDEEEPLPIVGNVTEGAASSADVATTVVKEEAKESESDWTAWWNAMRDGHGWLRQAPPSSSETQALLQRGIDAISCSICDKFSAAYVTSCCCNVSPCETCRSKFADEQRKNLFSELPLSTMRCLRCNVFGDAARQNRAASGSLQELLNEFINLADQAERGRVTPEDDLSSTATTIDLTEARFDPSSFD
jgi:hypothetical protein